MGHAKTQESISRLYYWPGMNKFIEEYIDTCTRCQASKRVSQKAAGLLQPIKVPTRRWAQISMDFITGMPETDKGNNSIWTIVDYVSKMSHMIPIRDSTSTHELANLFMHEIVRHHGIPDKIISDRDSKFTSDVWTEFCKQFKIQRALSTAWHPQSDGQTERIHRTLEQSLRTLISADEKEWETLLPCVELAYNCSKHSSTLLTPFEVMVGENPKRMQDLELRLEDLPTPIMTKVYKHMTNKAIRHIELAQTRYKVLADTKRRDVNYNVGDMVYLSNQNLNLFGNKKLRDKYSGPLRILERIGKVAYRLELPANLPIHPVFHVSLLKPSKESELIGCKLRETFEPLEVEGQTEYEIERILKERNQRGRRQFLIKWKGYPLDEASWEYEEHLPNAKGIIRNYLLSQSKQRKVR